MGIDLLFIVAFGLGFRHGYTQGIIGTIFNVFAYVFGVVLSFKITPTTANILEQIFNTKNPSLFLLAFIINMGLIMLMLRATANMLEKSLQAVYLGFFNRTLGGAVMAALSILIYSILLWFAATVGFVNQATIDQSKSYPFLKDLPSRAKSIAGRLRPYATEMWDTSMGWMERLEGYGVQKTETPKKVYDVPEEKDTGIENEPENSPPPQPGTAADNGIEK